MKPETDTREPSTGQAREPGPTAPFAGVTRAQGLYDVVTAIWPCVSMRTFLKVTGPKTDLWLVKTISVLIAVIGAVVGAAGSRRPISPEIPALAAGSAAGLAAADVGFVAQRRISPVYLLDSAAEIALIAWWAAALGMQMADRGLRIGEEPAAMEDRVSSDNPRFTICNKDHGTQGAHSG